ncbi:MAG: DUF2269 domain-containing protein [Halothiobacillaceae bacterium]|jgi:uncharacterized membrane protein|nr:DUF2269 domain-containing protein [Halothiobacillaceae bacterium]
MTEYLLLKSLHIFSTLLLFGTGLGSAFYKWMADRGGDVRAIATTNRHVVLADWLFTTPTIVLQPATGLWLAHLLGLPLTTPWLLLTLILYAIAGLCWLPVVALQIRMRNDACHALATGAPLPERYRRDARLWFLLGWPAFVSMTLIVLLMVFKPHFGG